MEHLHFLLQAVASGSAVTDNGLLHAEPEMVCQPGRISCMPLGRDLSGPPVLPRIHAVSGGRLVHNPLPFPDMGPVQNPAKGNGADPIRLPVRSGIRESRLEFYYHYSNFLVYGGAGSERRKVSENGF